MFDIYVDGYYVVPQTVDPMVREQIKLAEPVVTVDGKQAKVAVEAKNENSKRVSFQLHVLFVKDGVVTVTAQLDATLEPGQSRQLAPFVEGAPDGAVPHTQISTITNN